jgi:hypothetical protein
MSKVKEGLNGDNYLKSHYKHIVLLLYMVVSKYSTDFMKPTPSDTGRLPGQSDEDGIAKCKWWVNMRP